MLEKMINAENRYTEISNFLIFYLIIFNFIDTPNGGVDVDKKRLRASRKVKDNAK